jgi:hypothetical protein
MFSSGLRPYREDEAELRARRDAMLAERREELALLAGDAPRIFARRASRIAGGAIAMVGALALVTTTIATRAPALWGARARGTPLTPILLATLGAIPMAALVAWIAARVTARRVARRELEPTRDVRTDVERLSRAGPARLLADVAQRMETCSVWMPLGGCALVAPLSLHLFVAALAFPDARPLTSEFDLWIVLSVVLTIPAHATLAALALRFARRLRGWRPGTGVAVPSAWAPLLWTILAGCVPGIVLYLVPPILVAVTGLFVPIAFAGVRAMTLGERAALATVA